MRIVLFLGAGFASAFELPVMNTFMSFAEASSRISEEDKEFLHDLILATRKANAFLTSSATNLEDILSFAVMGYRLGLREESGRLRHILQRVFTSLDHNTDFWSRYDAFREFLGFECADSRHDLSIITTNYDLSIECALRQAGVHANIGFMPSVEVNGGNFYSREGVPLLKLHGSVNWYEREDNPDVFQVDDTLSEVRAGPPGQPRMETIPTVCAANHQSERPPFIVPPSYLKPDFVGPMRSVWAAAATELEQAELVAFVGYSFPQSDTEMKYFLARSLVDNATLRRISIIDPVASQIVERLKSSDSGYGSHFRELLHPCPSRWHEYQLDREISAI